MWISILVALVCVVSGSIIFSAQKEKIDELTKRLKKVEKEYKERSEEGIVLEDIPAPIVFKWGSLEYLKGKKHYRVTLSVEGTDGKIRSLVRTQNTEYYQTLLGKLIDARNRLTGEPTAEQGDFRVSDFEGKGIVLVKEHPTDEGKLRSAKTLLTQIKGDYSLLSTAMAYLELLEEEICDDSER